MIYLDASKKKSAVTVDVSNDKKLEARFPFGASALRSANQSCLSEGVVLDTHAKPALSLLELNGSDHKTLYL